MKKLLFLILILFGGIGIQTARAQCAQPYEMSRIPDYKAFLNADVDLTFGNYVTSATITKELVLPDGDLVIAGYFDKICQYDGTNTGITQTLTGLQGLARRDGITGIWSSLPTIVGVNYPYTYPYRIWYLDDTLYCWVSGSNGIRKLNPVTNTWSPIIFPYHVTNIVSAGTPFEYYVSFHSSYQGAVIDYVGLRKWNTQTGAMTVITGSTLPDFSSQFTINETQTSDTLTVILHDLSTSPMILIKGQTVPIFGEQDTEQKTVQSAEAPAFVDPTEETTSNTKEIRGENREEFEELSDRENEAKRILKLRKELGINTREDERRAEEAESRLNEYMKNHPQG